MLSPNVIETGNDIAGALNQIMAVNSFSRSATMTRISPLHPDPEWLTPLRDRMRVLGQAGQQWDIDRPEIQQTYLAPFVTYATSIEAVAEQVHAGGLTRDDLMALLGAMKTELISNREKVRSANDAFAKHLSQIRIIGQQLDKSLDAGWRELAAEEKRMISIAEQITFLQDRIDSLQQNLTSAAISNGTAYYKTAATISYTMVTAATAEIPFLSILSEVYTIGKMAYDLIVTDKEIDEAIGKLVALRIGASEAAQAAAMAKAVIRMIGNFNTRMAGLSAHLPALDRMWATEAGKIGAAMDAISSGADPFTLFDISSLRPAAASWNQLSVLARQCTTAPVLAGTPVTLSTDKTLHKAIA